MIGENIQIALDDEGIEVDWVKNGRDAEKYLALHPYDILLLDLGLPAKGGIDILKELRSRGNPIPVMVVTARELLEDRVLGLNCGADDYVTKPFEMMELVARMHALVRRATGRMEPVYRYKDVEIHTKTREAFVSGKQVHLSAKEWATLEALIARPGRVLSRMQLAERVYGAGLTIDSNSIEVFIHGLRRKLGSQFISNIRGVGYVAGNE